MKGMIPIPVPFYYIYLAIAGLSGLIPYALDRWLAPRLTGFAATLVFPTALTLSQYFYGKGPVGSWGSVAYTQTGNRALEQLLSVTGLSGIVFLIGWFASSINWAWEGRSPRRLAAFAVVMAAVLLGGQLRMALMRPSGPTVRVASLSRNEAIANQGPSEAINADLLARSEREARAGAKIVFWGEGNAEVLKQNEPQLIARGSALARQYGIYLGMAMYTTTPGAPKPLENKVVLVGPDGQVAWQYEKVRPTPGPEQAASVPNDGLLKTLDTPYGRIATPICYDMDFPSLLAQAGSAHVDLALSPANDWREIDPRHTEIASYRAIEQGFNLVRQSSRGLSAAYDYQGHVLAVADGYSSGDHTLVTEVPTRGVRTIYSILGDWLVWVSGAAFLALVWMALRRRH
jgi:apolipoprotein N-acyltransferase